MAVMLSYSSGGMTPPRDDDEGPAPAIIDSGQKDSEAHDDGDGQTAQINHCLGPDGYYHPVKEIKGSYLKKDKTGKSDIVALFSRRVWDIAGNWVFEGS